MDRTEKEKKAPQVSIIVPVYKVPEGFLRKCVESCGAQTLEEIEILLVDDGSPDDCGSICDEYAAQDERIRVIHKENGGLCSARNAGCLAARGEWIMFVDGDDWIDPDMCERMLEAGSRENVDLVMCGITKEYEHSSQVYRFYLRDYEESGKVYRGRECRWLQQQLLVYNGNIAVAYSKLIRRRLIMENNILHDEELRQGAEGLEFNLRLFEKLQSALFLNRPFYHYIYNDTSISASHSEENHAFVIRCFERIRDLIEESDNRDRLLPWFDNRLLYVIITTAISGYFNPDNPASYREKKRGYETYLQQPIVSRALQTDNLRGLSRQRKTVLFLCLLSSSRKFHFGQPNTVDTHLKIDPFTIRETRELLTRSNPEATGEDALALYAASGGVPQYIGWLLDREANTADRIRTDSLDPASPVSHLGKNLLARTLGSLTPVYASILSLLAEGCQSAPQIQERMGMNVGGHLARLEEDYGLVKKSRPPFAKEGARNLVRFEIQPLELLWWFLHAGGEAQTENNRKLLAQRYFRDKLVQEEGYVSAEGWWNPASGSPPSGSWSSHR